MVTSFKLYLAWRYDTRYLSTAALGKFAERVEASDTARKDAAHGALAADTRNTDRRLVG